MDELIESQLVERTKGVTQLGRRKQALGGWLG